MESRTLTIANAAHHAHPLLLRRGKIQTLRARGLPVGIKADVKYNELTVKVENRDRLFFMTDGIIEILGNQEQLYDESGRMAELVSRFTPDYSAETMVAKLIEDARDFGKGHHEQQDDMTAVVIRVL
jgi:sigma-B regulation protein RsbU (phosphoserine phosphatase)